MSLLNTIYHELDYTSGELFETTDTPSKNLNMDTWLDKGGWLIAAKHVGAKRVFFIDNNPVIVFAECKDDLYSKVMAFNNAWCLGRPRFLFLSSPGELAVYDLAIRPINPEREEDWVNLKALDSLRTVLEVSQKLKSYHRENIESGTVFYKPGLNDLSNRADKALIRDLKVVRRELIKIGLSGENIRFAHALIGRSIFIRYLEDRGILTRDYFENIAAQKQEWTDFLKKERRDESVNRIYYPGILANKQFTYALFNKLAKDFNGDIFPDVEDEIQVVTQEHLNLIRDLLFGDVGIQKNLFFYSYRFDIIPLELISSIYEEFYQSSVEDMPNKTEQDGAYYTPPVLVEFVLSRVLTSEILQQNPRVLDPACGSGIFLVEAFRRIVRYAWRRKWLKEKNGLTFSEIKIILKEQIAGIEVNKEAAKVAAFSLYLSMLHFLDPPAIYKQIKMGNKLPNLVASTSKSSNHYHIILPTNTFDLNSVNKNIIWKKNFGHSCADVVIGNPPWGAQGKNVIPMVRDREKIMLDWCKKNKYPIGDKEPSQAFLWRALDLLKTEGKAGMIVSAGVLFKHQATSKEFRKQWMNQVQIQEVYNFSHVRKLFFKKGADSPFITIHFIKKAQQNTPVYYWSAKQTIAWKKAQSILFSKCDLNILREENLTSYKTWKIFWMGGFVDKLLINYIETNKALLTYVDRKKTGEGLKIANKAQVATLLQKYIFLKIKSFSKYDKLYFQAPPLRVECHGIFDTYSGKRLLIKRGITEHGDKKKGQIIARYETKPFCFTHAIYGVKLNSQEEWKYKVLLGIFLSSLVRYYFFHTTANWGIWHHEIHLEDELLQLPVILDFENPATRKIIEIIDTLRTYNPKKSLLANPELEQEIEIKRIELEKELDKSVFKLYGLNEAQQDLIWDFCEVTLPFIYNPLKKINPVVDMNDFSRLKKYIYIFSRIWNMYLDTANEEIRAEIHLGAQNNMVAVEFFPADKDDPWDLNPKNDTWTDILEKIRKTLITSLGTSRILLDSLVYIVSDDSIIIIKRNEMRYWTGSLAREDANATLCKRMIETMPKETKK